MEKYIPYEKLSKKEKRKLDSQKRGTWGRFNPVTRKPENFRAYDRNKARNRMREEQQSIPGILFSGSMDFFPCAGYNADREREELPCLHSATLTTIPLP